MNINSDRTGEVTWSVLLYCNIQAVSSLGKPMLRPVGECSPSRSMLNDNDNNHPSNRSCGLSVKLRSISALLLPNASMEGKASRVGMKDERAIRWC